MMKKTAFTVKKLAVRAMVAAGALFGFSSCDLIGIGPHETVYGPPPELEDSTEVVEDVYGPPVENLDTTMNPEMIEAVYGPPVEELDTVAVPDDVRAEMENRRSESKGK